MTQDEKLKTALEFLYTTNAKGSSFDYYDHKAEFNRYQTWLFKYLEEKEISRNEFYAIVTELARRDLIEVNPPETKIDATPPNQIKISFKGMAFINKTANEVADIADGEIKKLQRENLILQNTDLKRKIPFAIIGFLAGGILSGGLLLIQQEIKTPIEIHVSVPKLQADTCYIIKSDTSKQEKK